MADPRSHRRYVEARAAWLPDHIGQACDLCGHPVTTTPTIEHRIPVRVILANARTYTDAVAMCCDTAQWGIAHSRCQSRQGAAVGHEARREANRIPYPEPTPDSRRVILVCGAPGSGKTTHARSTGLPLYDRDDPRWQGERDFIAALRALGATPDAQAVVIRSGARRNSRTHWQSLIRATETVVLTTPAAECRHRIITRDRPRPPIRHQLAAVKAWYDRYEVPLVTPSRDW